MAEVLLKVPEDVRQEVETVLGRKVSYATWQLLFSRFLNKELVEKLEEIKRVESIVSKSKMTEEQAERLANEVSLSIAKRFLASAGMQSPETGKQ